jgi:hypothetical protein
MRVSNNKARDYVNGFKEFQGSNTFGKWIKWVTDDKTDEIYVVYSYGSHFPMYIYDKEQGKWIGNKGKYSQSTTRHQSLLRPSNGVEVWYDTEEMLGVVRSKGLLNYTISKAQH